jgi:hypothetical protein
MVTMLWVQLKVPIVYHDSKLFDSEIWYVQCVLNRHLIVRFPKDTTSFGIETMAV